MVLVKIFEIDFSKELESQANKKVTEIPCVNLDFARKYCDFLNKQYDKQYQGEFLRKYACITSKAI